MFRNSPKVAEEALRLLLTLCTSLLGGSLAFLSDQVMSKAWRTGVFVPLLVAVAVCLYGILPGEYWDCAWDLATIRRMRSMQLARRSACRRAASFFMLTAFVCAIAGALLR